MVIFCKKLKKYNEIQLTKNKMDLNIRKMTNVQYYYRDKVQYYFDSKSTTASDQIRVSGQQHFGTKCG